MTDRDLLLAIRQALLMINNAIEEMLGIDPRTSELRREKKQQSRQPTKGRENDTHRE